MKKEKDSGIIDKKTVDRNDASGNMFFCGTDMMEEINLFIFGRY